MNREIKFRVWDKVDKQFTVLNIGNLRDDYSFDDYIDDTFNDPNSRYILLQYTGCKDMCGVEIYEGYKLKYKGRVGVVTSIAGMFVLDYDDQSDSGPIGFLLVSDMRVIGNIFENPELM